MKLKFASLSFRIPESVDLPSEALLRLRDLACTALDHMRTEHPESLGPEDRALVDALLTES